MKRITITMLSCLSLLMILLISQPKEAEAGTTSRIYGQDRYKTSVEVSKKTFPNGTSNVVIAVGNNFPDALAGGPLAYKLNAPILLTGKDAIPAAITSEITRLNAKNAYILGGESAVSAAVAGKLKNMGLIVTRISGPDRYETSVAIAKKLKSLGSASTKAFITNGSNFPDSLSASAVAARQGSPILLVKKTGVPASVKNYVNGFTKSYVIGGTGVISNETASLLPYAERIAGANRYDTSAKVATKFASFSASRALLVSGITYADALTGSIYAAKQNIPMLLTNSSTLPAEIGKLIDAKNVQTVTLIGGTSAISNSVLTSIYFPVDKLIETAKSLQGVPYLYGGTTTSGFDCSGYTQFVFDKHGVDLPRTTVDQWNDATVVAVPQKGDLVFFETYKAGPSHVGIFIGNNEFIHASSSKGVTISSMDNVYFEPRYLGVKSFIN
ncbi:cell wall-binding repeat-containing protein [Peribacillus frigoritolerans]|uniref:cell wall-binding repeat-containing protein n=1 Tax=Peribacillus frigoritolerans TaxID=450367 RepID=UPI001059363C|nr:cell wall-binding repeat-containing protein [Peribacillus frigoritolerans]TDL78965.1 N-acetylmuramoyl-L-alanine amidase [Peribacillus frigoritolerans]